MKCIVWCGVSVLLCLSFGFSGQAYRKNELYGGAKIPKYSGEALKTIAFPIGGLGTGNITLGGRGEIRELEVFNRPLKGKHPDLTFFSIWVGEEGKEPVAKILERQLIPPYVGWMGFPRNQLAGVSRFEEVEFTGEYPFARVKFIDSRIPVDVSLEAYNPFIPLSPNKSGIPAAIFNWKIKNNKNTRCTVSLAFSMQNPIKTLDENQSLSYGKNLNEYIDEGTFQGVQMTSARADPDSLEFGSLAVVSPEKTVDIQTRWYRGGWWDNAHIFWDDFADDGRIQKVMDSEESQTGRSDVATVLVFFELGSGEERIVPFVLTWFFPNRENYWNREDSVRGKRFRNYYAAQFQDAWDVAKHLWNNIDALYKTTRKFHEVLFGSTYPVYVLDAVSSQCSSLKTNLVMRMDSGALFGFEGLTDDSGCCPLNCTHVWNYEQTMASLFPSLERSVRETDFLHNTFDNGYQVFRTLAPLGDYWWTYKPCADGQMGNIVRVYREWKFSGDTNWLKRLWPKVKSALEFAWKGAGKVSEGFLWQKDMLSLPWDPDRDGVMEGEQHNTYDIEFYGPNTMTGSLYLAALKATAEMATAVGEQKKSVEYAEMFMAGSKKYEELLWNGEYYVQKIDVLEGLVVPDHLKSPTKACDNPACKGKESPGGNKASLEQGQSAPKYQYGDGCLSDQLLGQYLAYATGLGYVLEKDHVDKALKSIFQYNFKDGLREFSNVQRVYALNDEDGLLLCSWPKGRRPALPFVYSDEVWTGIEYQVAASLIYSGHIDEGLTLVKAIRERHRGFNRNPWDEFECGHHYARAMASWAVLLALSGFQYDGITHFIAFAPKINEEDFFTFWSTGTGWGSFRIAENKAVLKVDYGSLEIAELGLSSEYDIKIIESCLFASKEKNVRLEPKNGLSVVVFDESLKLGEGEEVVINFKNSSSQ
jgi:non-lysosomal glucosylceramidase